MGLIRPASGRLLTPGNLAPTFGLQLDPAHPMTAGLAACLVPDATGNLFDLLKPRQSTGGSRAFGPRGPTIGGSWSVAQASSTDVNFTSAPFSVAVVGYLNSITGLTSSTGCAPVTRASYATEGSNQGWGIFVYSDSFSGVIFNNNANTSWHLKTTIATAVGTWMFGMSTDGTTRRTYYNGQLGASSAAVNVVAASASANLSVDGTGLGALVLFDNHIVCLWNRCVTEDEMRLLWFDPFCMLTPVAWEARRIDAVIGSSKLFLPSQMNGLGAGGPFFQNPLG